MLCNAFSNCVIVCIISDKGVCRMSGRKRSRKLNVFLFDEELEILNAKADEAELSKSEYIRNMILFGAAHERTVFSKEEASALHYEINKIGNNLNQIAYRANSNKTIDDRDFQSLYANYVDLLTTFEKYIRGKLNGDN